MSQLPYILNRLEGAKCPSHADKIFSGPNGKCDLCNAIALADALRAVATKLEKAFDYMRADGIGLTAGQQVTIRTTLGLPHPVTKA